MKKIFIILLLLITILPAFSDTIWQEIQSKDKIIYIDTSSITNQDAHGYRKMLMKSDCANNLTGVQKIIVYDKNGKMIKSEDINQELSYVVPDSDAQAAYNYVYNIYKANLAEERRKNNAITPRKIFNSINSINNAGYEVNSIKNNAINVIKGF